MLQSLCAFSKDANGILNKLSPERFQYISTYLETLDRCDYARRRDDCYCRGPRIYAILQNIGATNHMNDFVTADIKDISLPVSYETLPGFLKDESVRRSFLEYQPCVLTDACKLEFSEVHLHFQEAAEAHIQHLRVLGQGGSGSVDAVLSKLSLEMFARKRVHRTVKDVEAQKYLVKEIETMKRLKHPHLTNIVGSYTDPKYIAYLMKPLADDNLAKYLYRGHWTTDSRARVLRQFFGCLAGAVEYLHRSNIRHRDLKLQNVLVKDEKIYVSDLGTALDWSVVSKWGTTQDRNVPATPDYMAPEVAERGATRNAVSDMWSPGIVFLDIVSVLKGFKLLEWKEFVSKKARAARNESWPCRNMAAVNEWMTILQNTGYASEKDNEPLMWTKSLLQMNPKDRPHAKDLVQMITESAYFHDFCCFDCVQESESPDFFYHEGPQHTAMRDRDAVGEEVTALLGKAQEPDQNSSKRTNMIQDWLQHTQEIFPMFDAGESSTLMDLEAEIEQQFDGDAVSDTPPVSPTSNQELHQLGFFVEKDDDSSDDQTASRSIPEPDEENFDGQLFQIIDDSSSNASVALSADDIDDLATKECAADLATILEDVEIEIEVAEVAPSVEDKELANTYNIEAGVDRINLNQNRLAEMKIVHAERNTVPVHSSLNASVESEPESEENDLLRSKGAHGDALIVEQSGETLTPIEALPANDQKSSRPQAQPVDMQSPAIDLQLPPELVSRTSKRLASSKKRKEPKPHEEGALGRKVHFALKLTPSPKEESNEVPTTATAQMPIEPAQPPTETNIRPTSKRTSSSRSKRDPSQIEEESDPSKNVHDAPDYIPSSQQETNGIPTTTTVEPTITSPEPPAETHARSRRSAPKPITSSKGREESSPDRKVPGDTGNVSDQKPKQHDLSEDTQNSSIHETAPPSYEEVVTLGSEPTGDIVPDTLKKKPPKKTTKLSTANVAKFNDGARRDSGIATEASISFDPISYIDDTWRDMEAAGSVATSVMSNDTHRRISGLGLRMMDKNTLLENFCKEGKVAAVRALLEKRCNPGTKSKPRPKPLLLAIKGASQKHNKCVIALIAKKCDVNASFRQRTPIHWAIERQWFDGYGQLLGLLLAASAEMDEPDGNGEFPLFKLFSGPTYAPLEKHQIDALALILHPKVPTHVDINVRQVASLNTALHLAVQRRAPVAVAILIHRGADVNAKKSSVTTPLLMAANQWRNALSVDQERMLSYLLDAPRLKVDVTGGSLNRTALHNAVAAGCVQAATLLLDKGANAKLKDKDGKDALGLARSQKASLGTETYEKIKKALAS